MEDGRVAPSRRSTTRLGCPATKCRHPTRTLDVRPWTYSPVGKSGADWCRSAERRALGLDRECAQRAGLDLALLVARERTRRVLVFAFLLTVRIALGRKTRTRKGDHRRTAGTAVHVVVAAEAMVVVATCTTPAPITGTEPNMANAINFLNT